MIKVATVCSGIGSPEQALRNLNVRHEVSFACEIDKYARETYLANFKPNQVFEDMTKQSWDRSDVFHKEDKLYSDLFIGGIPCQAFSLAGKRLGEMDPRGLLFFDFYRYVKKQQPKVFIIENVKGLLSDNKGKTFQNWLLLLGNSVNGHRQMFNHPDSLEYNLHYTVLNSKNFGVPQNRERVFIVGIRKDLPNEFIFPKGFKLDKRLKDILETDVDEKYYLSKQMIQGFVNQGLSGFINQDTQASQVHDLLGVMPTISAGTRGYANGYVPEPTNLQGNDYINTIRTSGRGSLSGKQNWDMIIEAGKVNNSQDGRVFDVEGISQCLSSGHNNSPKIMEPKAGRICGRNPENPKQRIAGQYQVQTFEFNQNDKISNTITTVQKDNVLVEPQLRLVGQLEGFESNGRIYDGSGIACCVKANGGGLGSKTGLYLLEDTEKGYFVLDAVLYRIRRLTPLECMRLQGFPDDFLKPCSDTQTYKQAGNSITVFVMEAIIKNLLHLII